MFFNFVSDCKFVLRLFPLSQISVISKIKEKTPCVHWFTGTPDPTLSFFKPFVFVPGVEKCKDTVSPSVPDNEDPAKVTVNASSVLSPRGF